MTVWDNIWETDSYSSPELRKSKAEYKLDLFQDELSLNRNMVCVDVGCGGGYISKEIYNRFKCKVIGFDISISAIKFATENNSFDCCNYFVSSASNIKLPDSTADVILCIGVLEHIKDIDSALREIYRILKDNGKFVIVTSNYYSFIYIDRIIKQFRRKWRYGYQKNWRSSKLIKKLTDNGLTVAKISTNQGFGDFDKINYADKLVNKIFPFWGRYIQLVGGKDV